MSTKKKISKRAGLVRCEQVEKREGMYYRCTVLGEHKKHIFSSHPVRSQLTKQQYASALGQADLPLSTAAVAPNGTDPTKKGHTTLMELFLKALTAYYANTQYNPGVLLYWDENEWRGRVELTYISGDGTDTEPAVEVSSKKSYADACVELMKAWRLHVQSANGSALGMFLAMPLGKDAVANV